MYFQRWINKKWLCQPNELYRDLFRNLSLLYISGVYTVLPKQSPSLNGRKKVEETKLIPASFDEVRDKAWMVLTGTNGHEGFELTIQNQGDEMFGWCKLDNAMDPMQMLCNVAVRQFVEANKLTIV